MEPPPHRIDPESAVMNRTTLIGCLALAGLLLAGCAASTAETAPDAVQILEEGKYVERRPATSPTRFQVAAEERTAELIAEPLTLERSEEHTSELQSLMRISYAVFCLKKKK